MFLEGQHSGYNYDMSSYRGAAQYTLDAFEAACQAAHEHCYEDIFEASAEDLIDSFCPDFVFDFEDGELDRDELIGYVETEMNDLRNRLSGKGGQAIEIGDYDGQPVDNLLLEKALDFMISLEPNPESDTCMEDYRAALEKNKVHVEKAKAIMRRYGEQITPLALDKMQEVFYGITNSGKYCGDPVKCSVAQSCLTSAWHGIGGWLK